MSDVLRHRFPTRDRTATTPSWLERKGAPGEDVQSLLSLLRGDSPATPTPTHDPTPSAAAPPEPEREPTPVPSGAPAPGLPPPLALPDEVLSARLPGPPRLGSLLPGGRSNPPPPSERDEALAGHIQAFASAAIELAIARAANLASLEGQLLDLAIEVAEALIEHEVEADPSLHTALARAALQSLGDSTHVTLRTSSDGFAAITQALGGTDVELRGVRVQIVADESIPGLGCVVDGENVRVDASVSERLRAVRRAFEEERRRALENVE